MKKVFVFVCTLILFVIFHAGVRQVFAGGCCYLHYSIAPGVANNQPAKITTAFTDPTDAYTDTTMTKLKPVLNQNVSVKILQPIAGQSCTMTNAETNSEGFVSAECSSNIPGDISVVFSLAGNPGGINEILSTVPLTLHFSGTVEPTTTPAVIYHQPTSTRSPLPKPVIATVSPKIRKTILPTPIATPDVQAEQVTKMQQKITELESEVRQQKQEVTGLRATVDQLLSMISKFFHRQ